MYQNMYNSIMVVDLLKDKDTFFKWLFSFLSIKCRLLIKGL